MSLPIPSLNHQSCRQGSWDDCWLISALVGLAYKRPSDILNMVRDEGEGWYSVTFPGREPVRVRPEDGVSSSDGVWAPVIEAAANKVTSATTTRMLRFGEGITLLTGNPTKWSSNVSGLGFGPVVPIPFNDNSLESMLVTAEVRKRVVVLGGSDGYWTTVKVEGLIHRHCYAILGYEAAEQHARVRDPAGDDGRIPDRKKPGYGPGEFWLTLDEVESSFCGLAIERN